MMRNEKSFALQKHIGIKFLVILAIANVCSANTETDGKFVYRYNPLGGELKFLPNSPPYWDKSTFIQNQKVNHEKYLHPFYAKNIILACIFM